MLSIRRSALSLLLMGWSCGWAGAWAACPAFTSPDKTLLDPPDVVTAGGNPAHYREWVYQEFPYYGLQHVNSASSWAVHIVQHSIDANGKSRTIAVGEAIYTTSEGKRIHVLGGLWPQQIIVPYAQSDDVIQDLGHQQPLMALTAREASLAPCAELGPGIYPRDKWAAAFDQAPPESPRSIYVKEIRDVGIEAIRFNEDANYEPALPRAMRRGSELVIWAASDADYYDNIISYHFRDDGQVLAMVGPTGWNTNIGPPGRRMSGNTPHAHTVLWRLEPEIADSGNDSVSVVRYLQNVEQEGHPNEQFVTEPVTKESAIVFNASEYTRLLISDPNSFNEPAPGKPAQENAYVLTLITDGTPRHRFWSHDDNAAARFDFAVVRDRAEEHTAQPYHTERLPNLFKIVNDEPLAGEKVAIYAFTTIAHIPRAEDFVVHPGAPDYVERAPLNLTTAMWSGIRLMPRNIHTRVPFSQPTPGAEAAPLTPLPLTRDCVRLATPPVVEERQCDRGLRQYSVSFAPINQNPFGAPATGIEVSGADLVDSPLQMPTQLPYGQAQEIAPDSLIVRPAAGQEEICLQVAMSGKDWSCPSEPQCIPVAGNPCPSPD